MSSSQPLGVAALALTTLILGACATAPETGRQQLLMVDTDREAQLGITAFEQKKKQTPISENREAKQALQGVGRRLARVVKMPNAQWEFVLFEDKEPNAFALPGGKVGVNTGLLPITKDEAGLATVVAHEIAHVSAHHGAERTSQEVAAQVGGSLLSVALSATGLGGVATNLAMQAFGLGAQYGLLMPYSRTQESEADQIGLMYMARAGYDPREAIAFWQRFNVYNKTHGGSGPEFMSTHPLDATRIDALQSHLPQALAEYRKAGGAG